MPNQNINLKNINKIFFSGIGGIGISAAARILNQQGKIVVGSDAVLTEITDQLVDEGIKVLIPQVAENVTADFDLFVHTVAIPEDNPERVTAKKLGIPQMTYPELLGELMANRYGIGVSGTNGKTTTTCILGLIFMSAGLDPTVVVGGKTEHFGGNSRIGLSDYFIFESDEYRRAFVNYEPKMAVVTYITADHLDYYKDLADIKSAFREYLARVPEDGYLFINADDANSMEVSEGCHAKRVTFGIDNNADVMAKNISVKDGQQMFDLYYLGKLLGEIILSVPAKYNVYNALAAISPALLRGVDFAVIQKTVIQFKGSWRRFEKIGTLGDTEFIADFAHTPDAVAQTISAIKDFYPGKKCLIIFQPHQYSRTKNFFDEFATSFDQADTAVILDIYYVVGRENPADFDVDAKKLTEAIKARGVDARYGDGWSLEQLSKTINLSDYDIAIIMGAGDLYNGAKKMIQEAEVAALELEEKYADVIDPKPKKAKTGGGFSRQKKIMEENDYYQTNKRKNK